MGQTSVFTMCSPHTRGDGPELLQRYAVGPDVLPTRVGMVRTADADILELGEVLPTRVGMVQTTGT